MSGYDEPKGIGLTCNDCKRYIDNHYCDYTCWHMQSDAVIPKEGCLAYQQKFGNFDPKLKTRTTSTN